MGAPEGVLVPVREIVDEDQDVRTLQYLGAVRVGKVEVEVNLEGGNQGLVLDVYRGPEDGILSVEIKIEDLVLAILGDMGEMPVKEPTQVPYGKVEVVFWFPDSAVQETRKFPDLGAFEEAIQGEMLDDLANEMNDTAIIDENRVKWNWRLMRESDEGGGWVVEYEPRDGSDG